MVDKFLTGLKCEDNTCVNPCPRWVLTLNFRNTEIRETEIEMEAKMVDDPLVTCTSPFNEVNVVDESGDIKPNTCPGKRFFSYEISDEGYCKKRRASNECCLYYRWLRFNNGTTKWRSVETGQRLGVECNCIIGPWVQARRQLRLSYAGTFYSEVNIISFYHHIKFSMLMVRSFSVKSGGQLGAIRWK